MQTLHVCFYRYFSPVYGHLQTGAKYFECAVTQRHAACTHYFSERREGLFFAQIIILLNVDLKIFAKILLSQHLALLSPDVQDSTQRVLSTIHFAQEDGGVLVSADAEKEFGRVDGCFLMSVLSHIGLGPHVHIWIQGL